MLIKIGDAIFDAEQAILVKYVADPQTITVTLVGGSTVEFTGDQAGELWEWYKANVGLEL